MWRAEPLAKHTPMSKSLLLVIVAPESGCYRMNTPRACYIHTCEEQTKTRYEGLPCLWPGCNVQHPYAVESTLVRYSLGLQLNIGETMTCTIHINIIEMVATADNQDF